MRLKTSKAHAEEVLSRLASEGYEIATWLDRDYGAKKAAGTFDSERDNAMYLERVNEWGAQAEAALQSIFPTDMEVGALAHEPTNEPWTISDQTDGPWRHKLFRMKSWANKIESILKVDLARYTDLPAEEQLFVEDIDSFRNVRDVNPQIVAPLLKNGRLAVLEDVVQVSLEKTLGESFHKKDHGGEENDLYSTFVTINARRVPTAFLLKGRGVRRTELQIADCGANGDQLVRLLQTPADLFVVQYVGRVSENVVKDLRGKIRERRAEGRNAAFCIIDGTDTARVMVAYGDLQRPEVGDAS